MKILQVLHPILLAALLTAAGRLYASTVNGKILCLGESNTPTKENVK
jgi:hypothetical protein